MREFRRGFDLLNSMLDSMPEQRESTINNDFSPRINTREGEFAYHIEVDLPGVKKEDINIQLEDGVLKVSGERKVKEEIKEEAVVDLAGLKEKFPSEAMYSLPLPLFSPLDELTKEQLKVLQLVHNFGSISDIIENTELSLEKTYSSLDFLLEEDYIEQ